VVCYKKRSIFKKAIVYFLIIFFIVLFFIPVYWMVSSSIKLPKDILAMPPKFIFKPTLENYKAVIFGKSKTIKTPPVKNFTKYLFNSVIVSFSSTLVAVILALPAGYTLARFKFRGKGIIGWYILITRMLPQFGILIPFYIMFNKLKLIDNYIALILINLTFILPFAIWMMKGFIKEIPIELEEAAQVDGCTRTQTIFRIILPLALPGVSATAVFSIILCWNEFLYALILTGVKAKTATVVIYNFITFREVI
jgi:multiple sugar transport system permease protein